MSVIPLVYSNTSFSDLIRHIFTADRANLQRSYVNDHVESWFDLSVPNSTDDNTQQYVEILAELCSENTAMLYLKDKMPY